ncbi:MAG: hypothetical protein ABI901_00705 [Roseiflexaceae bacterium]
MKRLPYAAAALALGGIILMCMGAYFVFARPPVLPEDLRAMGTSLAAIQVALPGLLVWLRRVFWVLGGYIFTTGRMTVYIALTSFRARASGATLVAAITGLTSIGWMVAVNFLIDSDFKWLLLAFSLPWVMAVALRWLKPEQQPDDLVRGSGDV